MLFRSLVDGRAGRYGLYDEGFVTAIDELEVIRDGLSRLPIPIMKAYVGFPEQLLNLPAEIDTLVKIWASMDTPSIYEKMEVDELLSLYMTFEHERCTVGHEYQVPGRCGYHYDSRRALPSLGPVQYPGVFAGHPWEGHCMQDNL